jgi:hypothetical protein
MSLARVNGSRPMVLLELRRRPRWRVVAVLLGLYCRRCGRWLRHALVCPRRGRA